MLTASPILRKDPVFPFSKKMRSFWEYLLLDVIKHPHAKFTPLFDVCSARCLAPYDKIFLRRVDGMAPDMPHDPLPGV